MRDEVSCIIPGASSPEQVRSNIEAASLPPLTDEQLSAIRQIYEEDIRSLVHHLW
jgi:aryl-alcohol dehydrogenase-like predicted oxidoreductase